LGRILRNEKKKNSTFQLFGEDTMKNTRDKAIVKAQSPKNTYQVKFGYRSMQGSAVPGFFSLCVKEQ
jgi:hypothetical protein